VRDTAGLVPDYLLTYEIVSRNLITNNYVSGGLFVVTQIDRRSQLLDTDKILDSTYDPYAFLRSAYLQRRDYLINGDENPEEMFPDADTSIDSGSQPGSPPNSSAGQK
jgi:phospholipid-binding lipoprotein MlaA